MYDPKSLKAEEFICHDEVLETLDYAQKNKDNVELIDSIIEKAKKRKGLSHTYFRGGSFATASMIYPRASCRVVLK